MVSSAGEVVWRLVRDETDELGLRHEFYRQVLTPSQSLARSLGGSEPAADLPVIGSELGVHFENGRVYLVSGYQVRAATLCGEIAVVSPRAAYELAQEGLQRREGFDAGLWWSWPVELVAERVSATRLVVQPQPGGRARLLWQVPTQDAEGRTYRVDLDPVSGEVLEVVPQWSGATCSPSTTTQVSAVGKPQNASLPDRSLWATLAPDRGAPWTHEAHKVKVSGQTPEVRVFMKTSAAEMGYRCATEPWHGVLPIQTVGGAPRYDDFTSPRAIPGRSAGDAVWGTQVTMQTLKQRFWRCGPTGSCDSPVVLDIDYGAPSDQAYYWWEGASNGVRITPKLAGDFALSASLDVVAHEWGHAVVHFGPGWYFTGVQGQLNEGFGDVLGHSVEWLNQPAGSGWEKADWMLREDAPKPPVPGDPGVYNRRVDIDDGPFNPTSQEGGLSFHAGDTLINTQNEIYAKGNWLPVALRLMSVGGQNPLVASGRCNPSTMPGCDTNVMAVGVEKASRTLMRVLTVYATTSTQWEDLADLAMQSAFDLFRRCSPGLCPDRIYSALPEQAAAAASFDAIGFPHVELPQECTCP